MSTLGTDYLKTVSLHVPRYGAWRADVVLSSGEVPTGTQTLTIGDLVLHGSVLRSGLDAADKPHAVVIGAIGWQSFVSKPVAFQSSGGVKLSTVLSAIASGAGEPIAQPADLVIGEYYELAATRPGEPVRYADALNDLAIAGHCPPWRVDPDGVTRFGPRSPAEVSVRATVMRPDNGTGLTTYGLDAPAAFLPGNTISGVLIDRLDIREHAGKLEADVWIATGIPSLREIVRRMRARDEVARTYIVTSCDAKGVCDLAPPPDSPHLPELKGVEQWVMGSGIHIAEAGEEALVVFADGRKTRPRVLGFKGTSDATSEVACKGHTVEVLLPPMVLSVTASSIGPFTGVVISTLAKTLGTIITGAPSVKAKPT